MDYLIRLDKNYRNSRPTKGGGYHPPDGLSPAAQKRKRK